MNDMGHVAFTSVFFGQNSQPKMAEIARYQTWSQLADFVLSRFSVGHFFEASDISGT